MRQTSLKVYKEIKEEGLLSKIRFEIYDYLFRYGPLSSKEVAIGLAGEYKNGGTYSSRFSELERLGCISVVGTKVCAESNRTVMVYDVTKNMPEKDLKSDLEKQIVKAYKKYVDLQKRYKKEFECYYDPKKRGSNETKSNI